MKIFFLQKFNLVDLIGIAIISQCVANGRISAAAIVLVVFGLASIIGTVYFKNK